MDEYGRFQGSAPGPYPDLSQQSNGYQPPGYQGAFMQPRGPANIRDSLSGLSRRDSPEPGQRSGSRDPLPAHMRDPSPKTSSKRDSPLAYRGESPLRLLNRSGRGSSPAAGPEKARQPTGGYNPQLGNLGFCLGGIRPGGPGTVPQSRGPPGPGGPGMGAFRSGGPVRAKADLLGAGADGRQDMTGRFPERRSRPQTAPSSRPTGSRPASPLGGGRATGSRPSSPQTRPPSPGTSQQQQRNSQQGDLRGVGMGPVPQPGIPPHLIDKTKHRSLSSHMRRAPSPTPAFNRNPSPSRPRWRM